MSNKQTLFDDRINVPIDKALKQWLAEAASKRVLTLAEMVRQLLRDKMIEDRKVS